jgi:hypothetical protein
MASPNPGISAAGEAAGRTALNPSAGPAAIGGMLVPGEEEPESEVELRRPEPTATPTEATATATEAQKDVQAEVPTEMQSRLSSAVSDISKLANALGALRMTRPRSDGSPNHPAVHQNGSSGEPATSMTVADPSAVDGGSSRPVGFGAGNGETGIGGYAASPGGSIDTQRQVASFYRM